MTRQIDCINLFSKMMRNMFELLYKDRSEIYNTSNKEDIRKIIDNTVNDTEIINIQNEFKKYTPTEGGSKNFCLIWKFLNKKLMQ